MVFFNYALRKLNAKIVYYGPGLCGKTTNLQWIHDNFQGGDKGKMVSLATEGDRTIFFDLLPLDIGTIRGMDVTLQLYTVPGQVHYNSTRQLVLRGADGVVFVADSQRAMQSSNTDSLRNLNENLGLQGFNLAGFPHVLQFNKRDLGDLMTVEEMDSALNRIDAPFFEAVAVDGVGVQESLEGIVRLVMRSLKDRYEVRGMGAQPSRLKPAAAIGPLPVPETSGLHTPSGIRPLAAAEAPTIPAAQSGEGLDPAEALGTAEPGIESVPFEEVDTQTEVLVPPSVEQDVDSTGIDPADRLPTGPGTSFETDDENVDGAQYDTADVEELRDSVPDEGVNDLVASLLGAEEREGPSFDEPDRLGADVPAPVGQGDEIAVETAPDEIRPEEQVPERGAFESEPVTASEAEDEPVHQQENAAAVGETVFTAEVDGESGDDVSAAGPERSAVWPSSRPSTLAPVIFDDGDPFSETGWEQPIVEPSPGTAVVVSGDEDRPPVSVSAGDNSLALKLTGTGAIVESGQVRALDIEVPVPGTWVGNRRVTLQLRLTLLPITEDENDGTSGPA